MSATTKLTLVTTAADGSITTITMSGSDCVSQVTPAPQPTPAPTPTPTPTPAPTPPPTPPPTLGLVLLPAGVKPQITQLDALTNWLGEHDGATNGGAQGGSAYPVTIGGRQARSFPSDYSNHGGMRYHVHYDTDTQAKHFIYAGDLYVEDPSQIAQMELDNNQVTQDGKTYIYGCQFNANDNSFDITWQDTQCHWKPSSAKGNPKQWPAKTWLHFEILSHRDDAGNITYDAVHLDGKTQQIGTTLPSARNIGWGVGHLLVNLQIGGANASGSARVYGSNLQVARW